MEYVIAVLCGVTPLAIVFWLNRVFGKKVSEKAVAILPTGERNSQVPGSSPQTPRKIEPSATPPSEPRTVVPPPPQATRPAPTEFTQLGARPQQAPTSAPTVDLDETAVEALEPQIQGSSGRPVAVDADHFKRHAGVPGFLYLARNDERREHLYKIGYTTGLPQGRMKTLNEQVADAVDIGAFRLVHSVPVGSSYDMEQALFAALAERRVVGEREFFYGPEKALIRAMDALIRVPEDGGESINDFLASNPWGEFGGPPSAVLAECPIPPRSNPEGGWIYVCRNFWHRPGTSYYSVSKETPAAVVKRLNEAQRDFTSQLGFYRIVACRAVDSTETARQHAQLLFSPYRIDARKQFVRASLDLLRTIMECVNGGVAPPPAPPRTPPAQPIVRPIPEPPPPEVKREGPILVDVVVGFAAPREWAPWTARCMGCNTLLRYRGLIGERANVECPLCKNTVSAKIGSTRVHIGAP